MSTAAASPGAPLFNFILSRSPSFQNIQLLQAVLLVLIAKEKHLIVRSPDEDVYAILKLTLTFLQELSLTAGKLKIRSADGLTPAAFLRRLFLHAPAQPPLARQAYRDAHPSSRKSLNGSMIIDSQAVKRSSSFPSSASPAVHEERLHYDMPSTLRPPSTAHSSIPKLRAGDGASVMTDSIRSQKRRERLGLDLTRPASSPSTMRDDDTPYRARPAVLPQVLVIAGLEHTSIPVQRALLQALAERRVVLETNDDDEHDIGPGVWNLPEGFFVVCICPIGDPHERPPLHRSLVRMLRFRPRNRPPDVDKIDKFAISANVLLQSDLGGTENRTSFASAKESDLGHTPLITASASPPPPIRNSVCLTTRGSPRHQDLAAYQMLASPAHIPISNRLSLYLSDLFTATRHHPQLDGMLLSARAHAECEDILRAWHVLFGVPSRSSPFDDPDTASDVSDEDVRSVFQSVVTHRLRVRDGPAGEVLASTLFGASGIAVGAGGDTSHEWEWPGGRRGVKDIIREIIDSV